ncbi:hypothetical protein BH20ACI3_BH20ACI3_11380 [soil metagenome]
MFWYTDSYDWFARNATLSIYNHRQHNNSAEVDKSSEKIKAACVWQSASMCRSYSARAAMTVFICATNTLTCRSDEFSTAASLVKGTAVLISASHR